MDIRAKIRKEINEDKLMIFGIVFILVFDFILYPLPILAKNDLNSKGRPGSRVLVFSYDEKIISAKPEIVSNGSEKIAVKPEPAKKKIEPKIVKNHGFHSVTAYTSEVAQTDSDPCTTANGFNVCKHGIEDTVAANFLKFGTKVKIPDLFGDRVFVVRDRMHPRYNTYLDVWMKDKSQAVKFGVKVAKIEVLVE